MIPNDEFTDKSLPDITSLKGLALERLLRHHVVTKSALRALLAVVDPEERPGNGLLPGMKNNKVFILIHLAVRELNYMCLFPSFNTFKNLTLKTV